MKLLWISAFALATTAHASMSREDYLKALQIAQAKVDRVNGANNSRDEALSSSTIKMLYGRYYQVGDHWKVAAWYARSNQAAMSAPRTTESGSLGIFNYEVTDVKTGDTPTVTLKITQEDAFGAPPVDPKVRFIRLTMNDRMVQNEKSYSLAGRDDLLKVSPEGIHSSLSPLELFPLDVPELTTAERQPATQVPALPSALDRIAKSQGFHPDLAQCEWFEQDDFFGRPIQVLWKSGNPWPSYLKTANGTAILLEAR
jgi:hypothetical protein